MKINTTKKVLAVVVATSMVFGSSVVAFAEDTDNGVATGTGIVEYDDSVAVEYDKITVPTIEGSTAFNFELDPTGTLHEYEPSKFGEDDSVFFATSSKGVLKKKAELGGIGVRVKKVTLQDGATTDDDWEAVGIWIPSESNHLKAVQVYEKDGDTPGGVTYNASAPGAQNLWIWQPDNGTEAKKGYTVGLPGKFVELTADSVKLYFEPVDEEDAAAGFKLKEDYRVEEANKAPIDGRLYYQANEIDADGMITDSAVTPLSDYVTITDGAVTAYKDTFIGSSDGSSYSTASAATVEYIAPEVTNESYSDSIEVVNKSTKDKTVSAVITFKNATGLAFKATNDYGSGETADDTASVYFAVDDGTATKAPMVISEDGKTASVTYTKELAGKSGGDEITYRTTGTNASTGGYTYARFEGYGATYTSNSFKLIASANTNAAAKDAWTTWAETVTAETKPAIEIVYKVENVDEEEEEEEEPVEPTTITATYVSAATRYELALPANVALSADSDVTNLKVNGVALGTFATNGAKTVIRINRSDVKATLGTDWDTTSTFNFTFTAGGVNYTATVGKNG
jgi:hypothetical protein